MNNWKRTTELIPDGVQTMSKRPNQHVDGHYPKYIDSASGAIVTCGGKEYIDYPCALGANLLGYNNSLISHAVVEQLAKGTLYSLPNWSETVLAEMVKDSIPSMERVRFLKTGSEATSAAVRIARSYTGRKRILCAGYHGWHDWYQSTTDQQDGVDKQTVTRIEHGNIEAFMDACKGTRVPAAFIVEPYIYEDTKEYLQKVRKVCSEKGIVLIFDEIITAFRTKKLSAQSMYNVYPDMTTISKGMGNGVPISAVGGKEKIMSVLEGDTFVSSTFGGDLIGIAAAIATIKFIKEKNVIHKIWQMGERFKSAFKSLASSSGIEAKCIGYPCRTKFVFPTEDHLRLFWMVCLDEGVLFGKAQFISFAHGVTEIDHTIDAMRRGMQMLRKYKDNPKDAL